ncbi:Bax inhibitor-1/YccA family protein [Nocardioides insulae]|uniref:Bax inhibitor-1/YccA family protein n=1 Tax=Nocardioides insulae TaxID=394734 RepID=UPI0004165071|nr:Bax inhibitor-1/YccA family protein [Nocardioides insulae]
MQSNNPVWSRSEGFSQQTSRAGHAQQGYTDPSSWNISQGGQPTDPTHGYAPPAPPRPTERMTIDSVVQSTGISLAVVIVAAFATWVLTPNLNNPFVDLSPFYAAITIGSLGAFGLSMVNSFKRVCSPALVIAFAALEGVALGGISKIIDAQVGGGVVMQAVLGTFAAFAGTLAAYKFMNIRVGARGRKFVISAMFGLVGLSVLELVLGMFGISTGIYNDGAIGILFALAGLALGVFMLLMDFDNVEQGIAYGLDKRESWRAAFGITVSLVWIYTNLLRLLAFFSDN